MLAFFVYTACAAFALIILHFALRTNHTTTKTTPIPAQPELSPTTTG